MTLDTVIFIFEILGVIAFSFSGAILAIKKSMDILGVTVLAVTTAVGGGIIRDVILGINPPMALKNPSQTATAAVVAVIIFCAVAYCQRRGIENLFKKLDFFMTLFDTMGLAAFTVTGVSIAHGLSSLYSLFIYVFVGTLTGVGGGVLRDILARDMPYIFVRHIYALASIMGALVCSLLWQSNSTLAMILGSSAVIVIRGVAIRYRLELPRIKNPDKVGL